MRNIIIKLIFLKKLFNLSFIFINSLVKYNLRSQVIKTNSRKNRF